MVGTWGYYKAMGECIYGGMRVGICLGPGPDCLRCHLLDNQVNYGQMGPEDKARFFRETEEQSRRDGCPLADVLKMARQ